MWSTTQITASRARERVTKNLVVYRGMYEDSRTPLFHLLFDPHFLTPTQTICHDI